METAWYFDINTQSPQLSCIYDLMMAGIAETIVVLPYH
jgi:hypothetical protein